MESRDADAFITPWAPEPEVVIDLVAAEESEELHEIAEGELKAIREDVEALKRALDRAQA